MRDGALLDRLYRTMREEDRPWSAGEIAQRLLRLSGGGTGTRTLVEALVRDDARFVRAPATDTWIAVETARPGLLETGCLLAWTRLNQPVDPSTWTLHCAPYPGEGAPADAAQTLGLEDPAAWEQLRARHGAAIFLTSHPAALQRFARQLERRHALEEWEPRTLDLTSWAALSLVDAGVAPSEARREARIPALAARWNLRHFDADAQGESGARLALDLLHQVADRLFEQYPNWSEADLERAVHERLGSRPVPWDLYAFGPRELEALPRTSGIYRFFGDGDALLYVGKSVDLARRVASYFVPLPPEPSKREEFLREIRRFEAHTVESELEALVRESRAIRQEQPKWNVQIDVHVSTPAPLEHRWPVMFQAPAAVPPPRTLFALTGPGEGWILRTDSEDLPAWMEQLLEGQPLRPQPSRTRGADPLHPDEVQLALRYFQRRRDELTHFESARFASAQQILQALGRRANVPAG